MRRRHFHVTVNGYSEVLNAWTEFTHFQERLDETWVLDLAELDGERTPAQALAIMLVWAWPSSWTPNVDDSYEPY